MHNYVENTHKNCVSFVSFCTTIFIHILAVFSFGGFSKRNHVFLHTLSSTYFGLNNLLSITFTHYSHSLLLKLLIY